MHRFWTSYRGNPDIWTVPALRPGLRVYAVGDIHGRFDLLSELYAKIASDLSCSPVATSVEIYLGDYVDRGPESRHVLDWLIHSPPVTAKRVCLLGNHESVLLHYLEDPSVLSGWRELGGFETLLSYGVLPPGANTIPAERETYQKFVRALPHEHKEFLRSLFRWADAGSYLFVHAGIDPEKGLDRQDLQDLIWIRQPFLSSRADFGRIIVHGHSPTERADIRPNRINVDTGAYMTGRLTCVVLEGSTQRILQTGLE